MEPTSNEIECFDGIYGKYKKTTAVFFDWAVKTSEKVKITPLGGDISLSCSQVDDCVDEICEINLEEKDPEFIGKFSKALTACKFAVEIREKVEMLFPFLTQPDFVTACLKRWYEQLFPLLAQVVLPTGTEEESSSEEKFGDLSVDENNSADAVLRFSMGCVFYDYEYITRGLKKEWEAVKNEKISYIAASAACAVSMRLAESILQNFQKQHPGFDTAADIYQKGVYQWIPESIIDADREKCGSPSVGE